VPSAVDDDVNAGNLESGEARGGARRRHHNHHHNSHGHNNKSEEDDVDDLLAEVEAAQAGWDADAVEYGADFDLDDLEKGLGLEMA